MTYADLFDLNEITSVIQMNQANDTDGARELVERFVITSSLGTAINDVALPQLDFGSGVEGKGIFVVGNYGTGKSHVMSFLSIVAENAAMLTSVHDDDWKSKLSVFAGKYCVTRQEIAVSDNRVTFYQVVCAALEELAKKSGFSFEFQRENVINVKTEFTRFMGEFERVHPNKGVLLVIDEVLDYLRQRDREEWVHDLSTIRALGEFCNESRFRIMAGVQQSLFDNPEFAGFAQQLSRIRARYFDFNISKEGVSQLIEQHLFKKTTAQREQVRTILSARAKYYDVIGSEIDRFVALFPAHPRFIDEFQLVSVVERREILSVLSKEARALLNTDVSEISPDLITSDKYWKQIEVDQVLRSNQSVARVVDNVKTIKSKIQQHLPASENKASAERLVEALGVNRLTTPTVTDPTGLTPEALKDNLLWWTPLPGGAGDSSMLADLAKRLLNKTRDAANGQYLAVSAASGQWYIDPTRDRDYDQEVAAYNPGKNDVQSYLNEIISLALELDTPRPEQNRNIREYAITWEDKRVERPGWLFFGFPSERSTAKPPLDFYIFIMPSKRITGKEDSLPLSPDEIYVTLDDFPMSRHELADKATQETPETFLDDLRKYTSACLRADICPTGSNDRIAFENIAKKLRQQLMEQYRDNAGEWITIVHKGNKRRLREWVQHVDKTKANFPLKSQFDTVAQNMFQAWFESEYPDYPSFELKISEVSRNQACERAIEIICGAGMKTGEGWSVLEGLGLAQNQALSLDKSEWLKKLRNLIKGKGENQVLNHSDLFEKRKDDKWWAKGECIEAEFWNVIVVGGIYSGDLLATTAKNDLIDAANLQAKYPDVRNFQNIKRISRPTEANLDLWRKLMEMFSVNVALIASDKTREEGITKFQTAVQTKVQALAQAEGDRGRLPFSTDESEAGLSEHAKGLAAVKGVLETNLVPLNTKAKMRNLALTEADIDKLGEQLSFVQSLLDLRDYVKAKQSELGSIERFATILTGKSDTFHGYAQAITAALIQVYSDPTLFVSGKPSIDTSIEQATKAAVNAYQELHRRHRLDKPGDKRKEALTKSASLKQLNRIRQITALNGAKLDDLLNRINAVASCPGPTDADILKSPTSLCPHCRFDPQTHPYDVTATDLLQQCEDDIINLHQAWTEQLLSDLDDPSVRTTRQLLGADAQQVINDFLSAKVLPAEVSDSFITALNDAFKQMKKRVVKTADFAKRIAGDGKALKVDELRARFEEWLKEQVGSDDQSSVRFVMED